MLAFCPPPAATCAEVLPSGCRPKSSGARRIIRAIGTMSTAAPTPMKRQPSRHPNSSITRVMAGVSTTPAVETPIDASATASPRFSTNHFESVTFTTRLPIIAAPTVMMSPFSTIQCQSCCTKLSAKSDDDRMVMPMSISLRPPCRSTWAPMKNPVNAMITCASVRA